MKGKVRKNSGNTPLHFRRHISPFLYAHTHEISTHTTVNARHAGRTNTSTDRTHYTMRSPGMQMCVCVCVCICGGLCIFLCRVRFCLELCFSGRFGLCVWFLVALSRNETEANSHWVLNKNVKKGFIRCRKKTSCLCRSLVRKVINSKRIKGNVGNQGICFFFLYIYLAVSVSMRVCI